VTARARRRRPDGRAGRRPLRGRRVALRAVAAAFAGRRWPSRRAAGGGGGGGEVRRQTPSSLSAAVAYVRANGGGTIAVSSQSGAAGQLISSGTDVAAIGGFSGPREPGHHRVAGRRRRARSDPMGPHRRRRRRRHGQRRPGVGSSEGYGRGRPGRYAGERPSTGCTTSRARRTRSGHCEAAVDRHRRSRDPGPPRGDTSQRIASATSSGSPRRPSGVGVSPSRPRGRRSRAGRCARAASRTTRGQDCVAADAVAVRTRAPRTRVNEIKAPFAAA